MSKLLMPDRLRLSHRVHVVHGGKACCVVDLVRSRFALVNHTGAKILLDFQNGEEASVVLAKRCDLGLALAEVWHFIEEAYASGLLTSQESPTLGCEPQPNDKIYLESEALSLSLELTRRCNLRCLHCYNHSGQEHVSELSMATINKVLGDIRRMHRRLLTLTLTGGEPLLFRDLDQVISSGIMHGFQTVRLNTNGTVPPGSELLDTLSKHTSQTEIQITLLGGTSETHDTICCKQGSFAKIFKHLPMYKETGSRVMFSFIKSRNSYSEIDAAMKIGDRLGMNILVGDIYMLGRARENPEMLDIPSDEGSIITGDKNSSLDGIEFSIIPKDKQMSMLENFPPQMPCGKSTIALSSNGDVLPCTLLQGIVVGNVYEKTIREICSSKAMGEFREKIAIDNREVCSGCELRYVCGNKCPAVSLNFASNLSVKNPFCEYYS